MSAPTVDLDGPWLTVRLPGPHRVLSWAVIGGGLREADTVVWHGVRNADLPREVDPIALLRDRMAARGLAGAVGLLTSTGLASHVVEQASLGGLDATAVVTVGLANARRAGDPISPAAVGTINLLVALSAPLSEEALVEALALAAEARTVAVLESGLPSPVTGLAASGTGTDCVVVAAPVGAAGLAYAGKHTAAGHLIGRVALEATRRGVAQWLTRWLDAPHAPGS